MLVSVRLCGSASLKDRSASVPCLEDVYPSKLMNLCPIMSVLFYIPDRKDTYIFHKVTVDYLMTLTLIMVCDVEFL